MENGTISRQAAIDALDKRFDSIPMEQTVEILQLRRDLRELPPAQPEQKWIPCSERLPEDGTEVFVYLYHNPKSPYIAWIEDSRWYTEEFEVDREYEPLAWMPLPEPYQNKERRADGETT